MPKFIAAIVMLFLSTVAYAEVGNGYVGERECFACHKQVKADYQIDRHGRVFTAAPGSDLQAKGCEACHGPGAAHLGAVDKEEQDLKIENFKSGKELPVEQNKRCLACHENAERGFWKGSGHEMSGVGCSTCHKIHSPEPRPTMNVCFSCHKERRAQLQRSSHMPLREGKMTCNDCHNPHGGPGPSALKTTSVNEICYSCHQEKRGPLVWEHPPVRENCANCHDPHGSNYESLLKLKNPYLCQTCHDVSRHPSGLYDGSRIPGGSGTVAQQLIGKGCLNCHSQVHGSNHPSGARFQR